jgi:streptogramin lyase
LSTKLIDSVILILLLLLAGANLESLASSPLLLGDEQREAASPAGLLTPLSQYYSVPFIEVPLGGFTYPLALTPSAGDGVWVAEGNTDSIVEVGSSGTVLGSYRIPEVQHLAWIWSMITDTKGNVWFADDSQSIIWRFDPAHRTFANFSLGSVKPYILEYDAAGGKIWFTSLADSIVGYLSVNNESVAGVYTQKLPGDALIGAGPSGIALDHGGHIFVSESFNHRIVELSMQGLSILKSWFIDPASEPVGIAYDDARSEIWFTDHSTSFIGSINLTDDAVNEVATSVAEYHGVPIVSLPYWVQLSADGTVWFNEHFGNRVTRFDPTDAEMTEFNLPTPSSSPLQIAVDDAGRRVWFSEFSTGIVGYIDMRTSVNLSLDVPSYVFASGSTAMFTVKSSLIINHSPELSGTTTREATLGQNMTVDVSGSGQEFTFFLSEISLSAGNYSLTVCAMNMSLELAGSLTANECRILTLQVEGNHSGIGYLPYLILSTAFVLLILATLWSRRRSSARAPLKPPASPEQE